MQETKLFLGPKLGGAMKRIADALERDAEALEQIAKAFASIAGSLERMSTPAVEVREDICTPTLEQDPDDHSKHSHVRPKPAPPKKNFDEHPCECGKVKLHGEEIIWREPHGLVHRARRLGHVVCDREG